jgi:hypothetical protein
MKLCEFCLTKLAYIDAWEFRGKTCCRECYDNKCREIVAEVKDIPIGIVKTKEDFDAVSNFRKAADFDATDGRHDMSNKLLDTLKPVLYGQDNFGMDKYGVPLKHSLQYDWLAMFFEEQADGLKYIQAEMQRRIHVRGLLTDAIEMKNWKLVEAALHQLSIVGTGTHKKKPSN